MSQLDAMCEAKRVKAAVKFGTKAPTPPNMCGMNAYTVKLTYKGRQYTCPFYTGLGWTKEPTAADVLSCLLSDAMGVMDGRTFEEWASDYGYDTDSRSAERIYKACKKNGVRVRKLLGTDFDTFASAEH